MTCRDCFHYLPSTKALPKGRGLDGYGYCDGADTLELRARLFEETTKVCWLPIIKFKAVRR